MRLTIPWLAVSSFTTKVTGYRENWVVPFFYNWLIYFDSTNAATLLEDI